MYFFLMPYAKDQPYVVQPAHSLFLDGEIALMLASRRTVEEKPEYKPLLTERVNAMVERFQKSRNLMLESYPDECWMFDHCVALDAIKMADYLDGSDHSALIRDWIAMAETTAGGSQVGFADFRLPRRTARPSDGPEGSSIWMVAHSLQLLDEDFARDQYQRARKELGAITLGFGYAHEWPRIVEGRGRILIPARSFPVFEISAGSSGMAFIGASSFGDDEYLAVARGDAGLCRVSFTNGRTVEILREQSGRRRRPALRRNARAALAKSENRSKTMIKLFGRDSPFSSVLNSYRPGICCSAPAPSA